VFISALTMPNFRELLGDRRETVGRARCVRDDFVIGGIIHFLVDAENDRHVFAFSRCGNDDFFDRPRRCLAASSAFVNLPVDSMTISAPTSSQGNQRRVFFSENAELVRADFDRVFTSRHVLFEVAHHRIVFQKMSQRSCVGLNR
jgi:hypothetical protein